MSLWRWIVRGVGAGAAILSGNYWVAATFIAEGLFDLFSPKKKNARVTRETNFTAINTPLPVVYGEARVGATIVYAGTTGSSNDFLWLVAALCHGEVEDIDRIYLNGQCAVQASGTLRAVVVAVAVTSIAAGSPGVLTAAGHNFEIDDVVRIANVTGNSPNIDGEWAVVARTTDTFSIGVNITTGGTGGTATRQRPLHYIDASARRYIEFAKYTGSDTQDTTTAAGVAGGPTADSTIKGSDLTAARAEWTSACRGRGIAYLLLRLRYHPDLFAGGLPEISADVKGRLVAVATASSTSIATGTTASANPIWAVRDYVTSTRYGLGLSANELRDGTAATEGLWQEALYCDEAVYVPAGTGGTAISAVATLTATYALTRAAHGLTTNDWVWIRGQNALPAVEGRYQVTVVSTATYTIAAAVTTAATTLGTFQKLTTQPRFALSGALDTANAVGDNLEGLRTACRGSALYADGRFCGLIRRGAATDAAGRTMTAFPRVAVTNVALTEANIVGDWSFRLPAAQEKPNSLRVTFYDALAGRQATTFTWPLPTMDNTYLTADAGQPRVRDIHLPFTTERYRAEQIAMVVLEEARNGLMVTLTATEEALALTPGDVVSVSHRTPGWGPTEDDPTGAVKGFWVMEVGITQQGLVSLVVLEYNSDCYDETPTDDKAFGSDTNLPAPWTVDPPTALLLTTGTQEAKIRATWTPPDDERVDRYEVEAKRTSDPVDASYRAIGLFAADNAHCTIQPVGDGDVWVARVRSVTPLGVRSSWASATHTVTIVGQATVTVNVVAAATAITYTVTCLTTTARIEVYTVENGATGQGAPTLTSTYLAANLARPATDTIVQRIATTNGYYRSTRIIPYDQYGVAGTEWSDSDRQATAGGAGPSGAPSALTLVVATQTACSVTWTNGDATATTRIYQDGLVVQSVASAVATVTLGGLTAATTYGIEADHYLNGLGSAKSTLLSVTTSAVAAGASLFAVVTTYSTYSKGQWYMSIDVQWDDVGAWEIAEGANASAELNGIGAFGPSGTTTTFTHVADGSVLYYAVRGAAPRTAWTDLTTNPITFELA